MPVVLVALRPRDLLGFPNKLKPGEVTLNLGRRNAYPQPVTSVVDCVRGLWDNVLVRNNAIIGVAIDIPGLGSNATFRFL